MNPRLTSDGPPGARGPPGCQRRATPSYNAPGARGPPSWPHPVACPLSHRSPGHTPPPNGGFCTIRRIAKACRRRVVPLMAQFPPFARARTTATPSSAPPSPQAHASNATPPHPRPHGAASPAAPGNNAPGARGPPSWPHPVACPPSHRSPGHTPPPNGGFCTIRRIATACRRRVAPLMLQFPPFAHANHGPPGPPRQLHPATTHPVPPDPPATARRAAPPAHARLTNKGPRPYTGGMHDPTLSTMEHRDLVEALALSHVLPHETLPAEECLGRRLAAGICSLIPLPPFTNSAMDGFALRRDDLAGDGPWMLPVVADIPAGDTREHFLQAGQAMRIMTGAPSPRARTRS